MQSSASEELKTYSFITAILLSPFERVGESSSHVGRTSFPVTLLPISPFALCIYFGGLRKLYRKSTRSGIGVPLRMAGKKCS